ncbi:MAG: acetyl-CoA carboxylase carboxyl transferase subunit alpha, partial [Campylobacterales bacterium]
IDDIIEEPVSGAHRDKKGAADAIKAYFLKSVAELSGLPAQERLEKRYARLMSLGRFSTGS